MTDSAPRILHQADVEAVIEDQLFEHKPPVTSTTTLLTSLTAAVNTTHKAAGTMVYNTSTGLPVFASGPDADDVWNTAAGVLAHTPV